MSLEFSFHTVVLQSPGGCPVISSSRIVLRGILRLQNEAAARGDVKRKAAEVQFNNVAGPILVDLFFQKWGSTGMIEQTGCFFGFGNKWLKKNEKDLLLVKTNGYFFQGFFLLRDSW